MWLTILLVTASGVSSLTVLPRMEDPVLIQRAANVVTLFPGADAERVEALVTEKIEEKLIDIPEIKRLRSQSQAGSSFIAVELRDDVFETEAAWSKIRGKLEESISLLPAGSQRPEFIELEVAAYAWIGSVVWESESPAAYGVIRRLARELKDDLYTVSGTKSVDLFGDPAEEVSVEVDAARAAAVGLSAASIAQQLSERDVRSSAGILRSSDSELVVQMENTFDSLEDILNATLVAPPENETNVPNNEARRSVQSAGRVLRLSDVASVRRTTREPPASKAIVDGKPAIVVAAFLRPEQRIDQWSANAAERVTAFKERLPRGVKLDVIMEQSAYVDQRMNTLVANLVMGVLAVSLVSFLFLGWRSSLLVTATLPVASLMVVAGMRFMGIPIHQMSVTGLIIALGLLIDNAIIAADEIEISLRRGLTPVEAVGDMVTRLFAPLLASTLTTALAFAPIALMEGPAGEFVGSIALTVMLAIFSSLFLALTILPAAAAWLQIKRNPSQRNLQAGETIAVEPHSATSTFVSRMMQHGISIPAMTKAYHRFISWQLRRPWMGIAIGCVLPFCGFVAATQLGEQFFPPTDRDQFQIEIELDPQASLEQTSRLTREIDRVLMQEPRIKHTAWFVGESAPAFYYNIIARRKNSPQYAQAIITLDSQESSLDLIREMQTKLDQQFAAARILVRQLEQGPPFDAPVELRLFGPDLDRLKEYGEELRMLAANTPDVLHVRTAMSDFRPMAAVSVNVEQATWVGLNANDVAQQLVAQLDGFRAGSIIEEVEEVAVRVRVAEEGRQHIEDLGERNILVSAPLPTASTSTPTRQSLVPISAIANIELKPQRAVITRYNGRRSNEVQAYITAGTLPSKVLSAVDEQMIAKNFRERLPLGYNLEFGGEASERNQAVARLMANVTILSVGMVASLVLALSSFRLAGLIGVVAALSVGLGMGSLWLFGYPFGFMAIIGTMGLIGVAINDSIVVVAALRANPLASRGDIAAAAEVVVEVTRHVLATTATTVVGFLPLLLGGGGFWPPLAVSIGAGVTGATLLALTFIPCAMQILTRFQRATGTM